MFGANDSNSSNNNNYNPLHKSNEADKFQLFEKWLRDNGAQFPQLELRQYDNNNGNNNNAAKNSNSNNDGMLYNNNDDDDDAEEKKDGGGSDMGDVASMLSLDNNSNTTNIEEDDGSNEMRSVHATSTIPPQTICVSIPKSCLITVEMGQSTPIGQAILQSDVELDAPKHIFLMIYLLYDKKINGQKSFFAPYYNILPKSLRNMPIFWNEHELQYLQGSFLLSQIADRSDAIREDYERICSIPHINFESLVSLDEFRWARMIVCSRNFGLLINGHRTSALVPHADMLNHHRPRETKWTFCEETQCFTITTLQSIAMGEQVYDSYGQKCNHRFLLNYGFCVERNIEVDGFCPNEVPLELGLDGFGGVVIFGENLVNGGGDGDGDWGGSSGDDSKECREKKLAFWTRGDGVASHHHMFGGGGGAGSSFQATLAAAMAAGASSSSTSTSSTSSRELFNAMMDPGTASSLKEAFGGGETSKHMKPTSPSSAPSSYRNVVRHVKRVRVCVSNNENTRILFSMLRVLASNSIEIDHLSRLGGPSYAPSVAAQRLFGLPPAGTPGGPPSSSAVRTCRDIRYPISLHNERRAMELLLDITGRALSKYPTSLAQDTSDLLDEMAYPKYSNKRNAKLQVRGEKEVLHHFALWARTAMHVIDIILHELSVERKLVSSSRGVGGVESGGGNASHNNEELGFEYVIQAMEDDDDCHFTILRYCSDVLGAVRRDELANIRY